MNAILKLIFLSRYRNEFNKDFHRKQSFKMMKLKHFISWTITFPLKTLEHFKTLLRENVQTFFDIVIETATS